MSAVNLCRPFDPFHQQAPVFVKYYSSVGYTLIIRPFCVTTDLDMVCGWLEQQLEISFQGEDSPRSELLQSYVDMLQSDYAQSFFCLLDERGVCQADVMEASYSDIAMYLDARSGDYVLRLTMSTYATVRNAYEQIVNAYLEYLFSFKEVHRVLTWLPAHDEWSNHLLKGAGFIYLDTRQMLSGVANIYECRKIGAYK
jgi:hypothetical protein